MAYFPMYVNLTNKPCLIVGGGEIAFNKTRVLLDFDADVTVIAKKFCNSFKSINNIQLVQKEFAFDDCIKKFLVVAATNDNTLNHSIAELCQIKGIYVNVVDKKEDCSFLFSSYIKEKNLVASFSSSGNSPLLTQILRDKEKEILSPFLGELNDYLGKIREQIKKSVPDEKQRKNIYRKIYDYSIINNHLPKSIALQEIIESEI